MTTQYNLRSAAEDNRSQISNLRYAVGHRIYLAAPQRPVWLVSVCRKPVRMTEIRGGTMRPVKT
ncbi:MAG: hypothetical protein M1472_04120 [Planctomycetes bacterium]|nr:hypothetical protein [Planctomycetota bacterium]